MSLDDLPHHVFYHLSKYLSFIDIENLAKTCKEFYFLIERDNYFWLILIQNHFGLKLYQRYVNEIFQNEKNSDYVLYRTEKNKQKFEIYLQDHPSYHRCMFWLMNILNTKESSSGYIALKSVIRQKRRPRTNELKMSLTIEQFFQSYLHRNKYLNEKDIRQISMYKLLYVYLITPKRLLGVDLFLINLHCTPNHSNCSNVKYPNQEFDVNSLTGRCIRIHSNQTLHLAGIKGTFQSILPGIYEIVCRIKLDKNNEYLTYYNECCNKDEEERTTMQCYSYALADYGLDCKCDQRKMNFDWFESNYMIHRNTHWFNETMGRIKVFELSNIYFGFRTKCDYSYRNILFDYIQLNIVE